MGATLGEKHGRIKMKGVMEVALGSMAPTADAQATVLFQKADYDPARLRPTVFGLLDRIGALRIDRGARVLIKPNFLAPAKPHRAMTTHPLVLRTVVEYVLAKGGQPLVADSPGTGSFERLLREGGYLEALEGLGVELRPFRETVRVDIGEPFGRIDIAREAVTSDVVINLPKLKTHSMMLLTLGVKNLFGCIVGLTKPEWHMRSGVDRRMFARLLTQIYRAVNPSATLVDGILGMEGDGPGRSGTPRHLGVLAAGASAPAVDMAICRFVGIRPEDLPTHRAAAELGLLPESVSIEGDFAPISNFNVPLLGPLTFGPQRFQGLVRKHLVQRPVADVGKCRLCGECWRYCPANAITPYPEGVGFNYDRCIRCYCCLEICPHGALKAVETRAGRLVRKLAGLRDRIATKEPIMKKLSLLLILVAMTSAFPGHSQQIPSDYKQAVQRQLSNKFNENQIISFVYKVYGMYDRHVPVERFLPIFASKNLEIRFPETNLRSHADFKHWYANIGRTIASNTHTIESVKARVLGGGRYQADIVGV
jgi:uncharacterized protein (DUF362 family)/Pyruvate/2-oxoacid:ferredoxin oxidoreductase delta subunit